jgi:glutathione S-transferase
LRRTLREGEQKSPEHLTRNPPGRLPVLELDPGFENVARWDAAYRERAPARAVLVT